jgi:S-DNA-T family DNA segregation ATPase FtsK/SpoIIIE
VRAVSGGAARRAKALQPSLLDPDALYQSPPASLLTEYPGQEETSEDREVAAENIIKLEDTLESFGIKAKVTHYERGPVLTRYEVEPERGIRVNQVARHTDDLRMALAAWDVRVEAPIPGKSAVGIEVPNRKKVTVGLRSLIECPEFLSHPSPVAVALGRDIAGHPVVADLAHMPHLLVAGATNSGKSVCLHSIIVSLLMRSNPRDVQLIMVDPKRVELNLYEGIPHLMSPVVNTVQQASDVLRKAIREMEKRLDKFAKVSAANIAEYNFFTAGARLAAGRREITVEELQKKLKLDESQAKRLMDMLEWGGAVLENDDPEAPWRVVIDQNDERTVALPRVIILIDELADLMMQARAEFEFSLCRIAQLARATGIHLVIATQRPSVKVVTGNIKANIPSRIALSVASQVDSRTILDGIGAERLIGRGDMLYSPIDASKPRRAQGAFVSRQEIEAVANYCRTQGEPSYSIIPEVPAEEDYSGNVEPTDELYADALHYVVAEGEASVSMIQRRFKVGYARAGRLIDMMAQRGVVGPSQGPKPRQVLIGTALVDTAVGGALPGPNLHLPNLPPPDPNLPEEFAPVPGDGEGAEA